jgi:hypothetical protein
VSANGSTQLVIVFAGLITAFALSTSRTALFWFVVIGGLVVTGLAQLYLPGSKYLRYVVPLATLVMLMHGAIEYTRHPRLSTPDTRNSMIAWMVCFIGVALVSTTINWSGLGVAFMGLKGYFQMWAFLFALTLIHWRRDLVNTLPRAVLLIAFLQLPFVAHQYLFLVPQRLGLGGSTVAVDIVAGTFGASMLGGGANAVLAAFMVVVVACIVGVWKRGCISRTKAVILSLLLLSPVFINEAKVTIIYLPVVFVVLFYRDIIRHPVRFIASGLGLAALLAGLMTALTLSHGSEKIKTWSDLVEFTFERQTASIAERAGYSELSRWTALTFWAEKHAHENPVLTIIGHGPGASRVVESGLDLAETLAETKYGGLPIGYTAVSALLWDTGVLGLVLVLGLFGSAYNKATLLMRHYESVDPYKSGIFDGLRAGIVVLAISLAHKDFFVFHLPFQTMLILIFGYLAVNLRDIQTTAAPRASQTTA